MRMLTPVIWIVCVACSAQAQVGDIFDAPIAFYNATESDLTIEGVAVMRRNGHEMPLNAIFHFKPGQYSWLEINNQKVPGVTFTFLVRTGGQASSWTTHSQGATADGYFRVDFTKEQMQTHLQTAPALGQLRPALPSAAERRRQFLQQHINRVQAAIQQDQDFILRLQVATGMLRGAGEGIDALGRRSEDPTDVILGAIFNGLTKSAAGATAQDRFAAEARIQANRELLQRLTTELNSPLPL